MEPITLPDFRVTQGAALDVILELYQDDDCTNPVDLTGKIFAGQIRAEPDSASELLGAFTLTVLEPGTKGRLHIHLHAADTPLMPVGGGWHDIKEITPGVEAVVWFEGKTITKKGKTAL